VPGKSRGQWAQPHFWAHNTGYNWARGHFLKSKIYFLFCLAIHPGRGGGPGLLIVIEAVFYVWPCHSPQGRGPPVLAFVFTPL
jgi:hypothetical protein